MRSSWALLAAGLAILAFSGCDESGGTVKTKADAASAQTPVTAAVAPAPAAVPSQAEIPPQARALQDTVADLPATPTTAKRTLDGIFDNNHAAGDPALVSYHPTRPTVTAPPQADIDAKRKQVQAAYANTPLHRSGKGDQPVAGTLPAVPLPSPTDAAGDANVRGGGATLVAFDAYLRDTFGEAGKVFSRAFWGAAASRSAPVHQNPTRVTIHHTDGPQTMTVDQSRATVKSIQEFHQRSEKLGGREWADIGYHFLIDGGGNVFEGRHADVIGAHVWQHNTNNIGIANIGDYNRDQLTEAQKTTLKRLIVFLALKYHTDPRQSGFIEGHHHFTQNDTDCPGKNVDAFLPELRRLVGEDAVAVISQGTGFVPLLVSDAPSSPSA